MTSITSMSLRNLMTSMTLTKWTSISCALLMIVLPLASAAEVVVWQDNPINIALKTGVERRIDFPEPVVEIDAPQTLTDNSRILLKPDGKLFWLPNADFDKTRIMVTSITGSIYLFDVTANAEGREDMMQVIDPAINGHVISATHLANATQTDTVADSTPANAAMAAPIKERPAVDTLPPGLPDFLKTNHATTATASSRASAPDPSQTGQTTQDIGYIEMARFAMAHYTGPARLIPSYPASRIGVKPITKPWLRVMGHRIRAKPLGQWQMSGKYVTAIVVRNQDRTPLSWDPRALRGDFEFASALHSVIAPAGHIGDESLWVVVSARPFNEAVGLERQP